MGASRGWRDRTGAGMALLAPIIPLIASVLLVFLYVPLYGGLNSHHWAVASALAITVFVWAALGWLVGRSDVRTAHPRVYLGLVDAVMDLEDLFSRCRSSAAAGTSSPACTRLEADLAEIKLVLGLSEHTDPPAEAGPLTTGFLAITDWRSGAGYTAIYRRLHAIGAQAILVCPLDDLRESARKDYLRLANSHVPGRDTLQYHLKKAVSRFGEDPESFFERPSALDATPGASVLPPDPPEAEVQAGRFQLKTVRSAVADYRDSRFDGIVRERARAAWTIFAASAAAYAALALAVMAHASADVVAGGMILFLIGALVGLLNRLALIGDSVSEVEDYGLSHIRLLQTVMLSGLAAVLGVVVVVFGTASAANSDIFPPQSTDGSTNAPPTVVRVATPDLASLFEIQDYPLAVAIAAIFGFTPRLLFSRLESGATRLKQDLKSSETSGSAAGST